MLSVSFKYKVMRVCLIGFPHSEISGSKVVWHLPEAYRSWTTSFIAFFSLGIHHTPLFRTPARSSENRVILISHHCITAMRACYLSEQQTTSSPSSYFRTPQDSWVESGRPYLLDTFIIILSVMLPWRFCILFVSLFVCQSSEETLYMTATKKAARKRPHRKMR